ncbi:MAG: hypothetical protein WBN96_12020, partial [Gammaproteobacteria bacterium]
MWVADQRNGILHIFKQSDLNNGWKDAQQTTIDLIAATNNNGETLLPSGVSPGGMHISGFTNHSGLDPDSRAIMGYLNGQMQIWKTNGGTLNPELVETIDVSTQAIGSAQNLNSNHMCGSTPDNTLIGCASIFNGEITLLSMDIETDTYTRYPGYPVDLLDLGISGKVPAGSVREAAVNAVLAEMQNDADIVTPGSFIHAVCSNFDTSSKLWYVTTNWSAGGGNKGGMLVVDVSDPTAPAVIEAIYGDKDDGIRGYGCGLLNTPDGKYMVTNVGHKSNTDVEGVLKWKYADIYDWSKTGPADEVEMSQADNSDEPVLGVANASYSSRSGDAHGSEFAGLGSGFMWQVQRVDDNIQVLPTNGKLKVVNKISAESSAQPNPTIDVIDRSALGTRMYISTRNAQPRTAISELVDVRREPGVMVFRTLFGYRGSVLKTESMDCKPEYEEAGRTQEIGINCTQNTVVDGVTTVTNSSD